ncbi:inositol monophosphatase family protein [Stomatohabitans albus]|uniref:inositol monophosphatase family protein n=1 Tax=Stomatohabitans albus TaxID=3110766 RepID=UPI00300D3A9D
MNPRLEAALAIAKEAGQLTLEYFNKPGLQVEMKQDSSPVTLADTGSEALIRTRIGEQFPGDGMVGEEFGEQLGTSDYVWTIDPIDGTKSFIHGVPLYGVLIAVEDVAGPLIGVVHLPALGETVYAIRDGGAFWERADGDVVPAKVRTTTELTRMSLILTSGFEWATPTMREAFIRGDTMVRTWGDAYAWLLLATGRADAMIDHGIMEYDIAPLRVIIPEAGGAMTVWTPEGRDDLAAVVSTKGLHDTMLSRFKA